MRRVGGGAVENKAHALTLAGLLSRSNTSICTGLAFWVWMACAMSACRAGLSRRKIMIGCAYGRQAALSSAQLAQTFAVDALTNFIKELVPWRNRGSRLSLAYNQSSDSLFIHLPATRRARSSDAKSSSTQIGGVPVSERRLFFAPRFPDALFRSCQTVPGRARPV